jgi:protease-4
VLLRVDSPGGAAMPIESISERFFTASRDPVRGKPVAAIVEDGGCFSAAYYLASQASAGVYLTAGAAVGSIGTILMTYDISGLLDRWGVKVNTIKSTASKDVGSPFRAMSDADRALLQDQVDRYDAMFVAAVARGRNVPESRVREWQKLRLVEGQRAVAAGMADGVRSSVYPVLAELAQRFPAKSPAHAPHSTTQRRGAA